MKESRAFNIEFRGDNGKNILTGYAAVFNSASVDLGGFIEVIQPGAFGNSLSNNKDIKALFNHISGQSTLGRTGINLKLSQDSIGLHIDELDIPPTTAGNDLAVLARTGIVTQCSFGFVVVKDSWTDRGDDMLPLRTLIEVELIEISVGVTFPAYEETSTVIRNAPDFVRNHGKTDSDLADRLNTIVTVHQSLNN